MSGDELRDGMTGATLVICNDYEFELIRQKTGLDEDGDPANSAAPWSSPGAKTAARSYERHGVESTCRRCRRIGLSIRPASAMRSAAGS